MSVSGTDRTDEDYSDYDYEYYTPTNGEETRSFNLFIGPLLCKLRDEQPGLTASMYMKIGYKMWKDQPV
jgi:hypothetical protein